MRNYDSDSPPFPRGVIEDCGGFGVWWYMQPTRSKGDVIRWAFALRNGDAWQVSRAVCGYLSRVEALRDGTTAAAIAEGRERTPAPEVKR